jgi:hypothetical protein
VLREQLSFFRQAFSYEKDPQDFENYVLASPEDFDVVEVVTKASG